MSYDAPLGWRPATLGELVTLQRGFDLPKSARRNGTVPVVSSAGISGSHDAAKVEPPGVVVGRYGTLGRVVVLDEPFWPLNTTLWAKDLHGNDCRYVAAVLETIDYESLQDKTSVPGVNRNHLHALDAVIPPLEEQRRIAWFLGTFDAKARLAAQRATTCFRLADALFCLQFGEDVTGEDRLGDHIAVTKGRSYKSAELVPSETALVTLKSVQRGGGYVSRGLKPYAGEFKDGQRLQPGELVVAHTDLTQEAEVIGRPALVEPAPEYTTLVASLDLAVVRPASDAVTVPFLYHLMLRERFHAHARAHANGTTVLHLAKDGLPSFEFGLPDPAALATFSDAAGALHESARAASAEARTTLELRRALLPKLVSGETRVPDTDEVREAFGAAGEKTNGAVTPTMTTAAA
jgi:type I restriction enzyme, S subunit